jgi:hypothetical protein
MGQLLDHAADSEPFTEVPETEEHQRSYRIHDPTCPDDTPTVIMSMSMVFYEQLMKWADGNVRHWNDTNPGIKWISQFELIDLRFTLSLILKSNTTGWTKQKIYDVIKDYCSHC